MGLMPTTFFRFRGEDRRRRLGPAAADTGAEMTAAARAEALTSFFSSLEDEPLRFGPAFSADDLDGEILTAAPGGGPRLRRAGAGLGGVRATSISRGMRMLL